MQGTASPGTGSYPGVHSPRLKAARRLNKRAFRQRERAFLAEGPQAVAEAFHCGAQVTDLFVTVPARTRHRDLVAAIAAAGIPVHVVSGEVMDELAQTVTPQGLLAVCGFVDVPLAEVARAAPALVALLANVRDPGNAGTVLRTADAAGAHAVVFADASVDPYNGKCVRASAGSLFHLPVVAGTRLEEAVVTLREAGLRIVAADGRAGRSLDDPEVQARLAGPTAWMFGNEAWGLAARARRAGGRTRRGAHLRPGREPQSGRRGRSVSLRVRACATEHISEAGKEEGSGDKDGT